MTRLQENKCMVERVQCARIDNRDMAVLAAIMVDISKSLAVIAEQMTPNSEKEEYPFYGE